MKPAQYDIEIVRGTSGPTQGLVVRLKSQQDGYLVNVPYSDVRLTISKGLIGSSDKEPLIRVALSDGGLVVTDPVENQIEWQPTTVQTRQIPLGQKSRYELEVWNGDAEIVYLMGNITGVAGINDDQEVLS